MTATSFLTIMAMLAVVLGAMGVALRVLRRYAVGGASVNGTVKMEIVQRLTLGQRQGIAVVRVGQRILVVSMGDGGVHPVAELDENDLVTETGIDSSASVIPATIPAGIASGLRKLALLKSGAKAEPVETTRISYVAPMEDFEAVLSMAMGGGARS